MATLKDHQQAMVDLLASGSGIPASASRLAHAMHDVVDVLIAAFPNVPLSPDVPQGPKRIDATTPGLNDKALAADVEACQIKLTGAGGGPKATPAERRVKELENTVKQLRESRAKQKAYADAVTAERDMYKLRCGYLGAEQAGCRKDDTQVCEHKNHSINMLNKTLECHDCGWVISWPEDFDPQAHMRETIRAQNSCSHDWSDTVDGKCQKCGESL